MALTIGVLNRVPSSHLRLVTVDVKILFALLDNIIHLQHMYFIF